jgi:hypothetical protein
MPKEAAMEKFDAVLRKIMAVPREEILKRDKAWKRKQARKKQAAAKRGLSRDQTK